MKILAIDWGKKNIGIAISDKHQKLAFPREALKNNKKLINSLHEIVQKEHIEKIVLGYPITFKGNESESAEAVKKFYEKLKKALKIEIVLFDERLTSKIVETAMEDDNQSYNKIREKKDSLSAVVILQNYLDAQNNQ